MTWRFPEPARPSASEAVLPFFGSLVCVAIIDRGLSSEIKSDRTDHIALHKGALCGVFDVVCRKIAGSKGVALMLIIDCCADDTIESHDGEHLDFAQVCCLMTDNHRIRAPLARTLTPVGQPCDVGSTVPLPVSVGISRYRA
jgi:hypothetical protein